jgi:hypothetical protein
LVSLMELLLVSVRQAAATVRILGNDMTPEERITSGQEMRTAATSVCSLNEVIYGASGAWNGKFFLEFGDNMLVKNQQNVKLEKLEAFSSFQSLQARWEAAGRDQVRSFISDCAGSMLHDYLSAELWDLPTDIASFTHRNEVSLDELPPVHTFQDNTMIQKVQMS